MTSWEGIVENYGVALSADLDQITPEKSHISMDHMMGFTISPRKVDYSKLTYPIFIWMMLRPIQYLFDNYTVTVYSEFANGRLHFHGYVSFPESAYSKVYLILNSLEYNYTGRRSDAYKIKSIVKGVRKTHRISPVARVKAELRLRSESEWMEYCSKDVETTKRILGEQHSKLAVIDNAQFNDLNLRILARFNIIED